MKLESAYYDTYDIFNNKYVKILTIRYKIVPLAIVNHNDRLILRKEIISNSCLNMKEETDIDINQINTYFYYNYAKLDDMIIDLNNKDQTEYFLVRFCSHYLTKKQMRKIKKYKDLNKLCLMMIYLSLVIGNIKSFYIFRNIVFSLIKKYY